MPRGRPRKPDPTIPSHIDQARLPAGIYWDRRGNGRWYVFEEEDGKRSPRGVAGRDARLSDLHGIAERRLAKGHGTVLWLCEQFEQSQRFRRLAAATRASYIKSRKVVCTFPTRAGSPFGELQAARLSRPLLQRVIDRIAEGTTRDEAGNLVATPTKAVHVLRYLSVMLRWAANRGHVSDNPAAGLEAPQERGRHTMPSPAAFAAIVQYTRTHGHDGRGGVRGKPGTCPSYLWPVAEITYLCRLRGIEATTLTDAHILETGLLSNRRKGSRDNITEWTPRLRAAVDALLERRRRIWERRSFPTPLDPARRALVVTTTGDPITKSGFDSSWQRMMSSAIAAEVIAAEDRFSLHGLKHRGVTDTEGTGEDKQQASGHRSRRMVDHYDHSVPTVLPAGSRLQKKPPGAPV